MPVAHGNLTCQDTPQAQLGQGTFRLPDGSIFVVKDNKVMKVDVTKLPANFGSPPLSKNDVALTVAVTIMGCWTGV